MINPDNLTKRYYKIGEVAKMFDMSTSLIRYWETEFPQLKPLKTKTGIRKYQKEDILVIDKIYELVKVQGYKLEGARNEMKKKPRANSAVSKKSSQNLKKAQEQLLELRTSLIDLKNTLKQV